MILTTLFLASVQFSSIAQLCPTLCDLMDCSMPGLPVHGQLPEVTQIHGLWVSDAIHPVFCCSLLPSPLIFPNIRVFSNESALCIRCPKYWCISFNISPSNEYSELISLRMDWLDFFAVQGTLKSLLQHHSSKAKFFSIQPSLWSSSYIHTWLLEKNHRFDYMDLCPQSNVSAF